MISYVVIFSIKFNQLV